MSRIDSFIRRLEAQRACLDWAVVEIAGKPGVIMEIGLGNGRTYDHLREKCPGRTIYVFDRQIGAHPDCIPPAGNMLLGEFSETLPQAALRFKGQAALVHADTGSGDAEGSRARAALWAPFWRDMLAVGGLLLSDQPLSLNGLQAMEPPAPAAMRYHVFRRA